MGSWCNIQAPKVEVLVLNFQTKNYTLPEFVEKANELKVLIVSNCGFFHAEIKNFQLLWSLPNLKRIRLEKISISSLCKTLVPLKSLYLLWSISDEQTAVLLVERLLKLEAEGPVRLDGELELPDGAGVNWREFAYNSDQLGQVLVKTMDGVEARTKAGLFRIPVSLS